MKCWNILKWNVEIAIIIYVGFLDTSFFWKDNIPVLTGKIEMVKWLYMKIVVVEYVPRKVDGK